MSLTDHIRILLQTIIITPVVALTVLGITALLFGGGVQ